MLLFLNASRLIHLLGIFNFNCLFITIYLLLLLLKFNHLFFKFHFIGIRVLFMRENLFLLRDLLFSCGKTFFFHAVFPFFYVRNPFSPAGFAFFLKENLFFLRDKPFPMKNCLRAKNSTLHPPKFALYTIVCKELFLKSRFTPEIFRHKGAFNY